MCTNNVYLITYSLNISNMMHMRMLRVSRRLRFSFRVCITSLTNLCIIIIIINVFISSQHDVNVQNNVGSVAFSISLVHLKSTV